MSLRKEWQEYHPITRRWRDSIALLCALQFTSIASAQTATVSVYAPPMPILKKGVGLWQAQREACVVTIVYSDGKKLSTRAPIGIPVNESVIPATSVRGVFHRAVDACICEGVLDNGDKITINLPCEPVVFSRPARQGLKVGVVMVAVPIECPTGLVRSNGERFEAPWRFWLAKPTQPDGALGWPMRQTTPDAVLTLIRGAKKIASTD